MWFIFQTWNVFLIFLDSFVFDKSFRGFDLILVLSNVEDINKIYLRVENST